MPALHSADLPAPAFLPPELPSVLLCPAWYHSASASSADHIQTPVLHILPDLSYLPYCPLPEMQPASTDSRFHTNSRSAFSSSHTDPAHPLLLFPALLYELLYHLP